MRSHVTFRTSRFNQTEVQPHFINERCFGEDCIAWLTAELRVRGRSELVEPWQEDWGWQASGECNGRRYRLSVGLMEEKEPEWLVHITERASLLDRLRGRGALTVVPTLAPEIHAVLRSAPDIRDIAWHFEDVFLRGNSTGASEPGAARSASEAAT